jgi:ketosteroid isomerase-like protein
MKATLALCLLLVFCTLPMARSATNNAEADREKLLALENAWNQAQLHHDAAAVGQLLPETFIYTDYDGTVMNKAKFLADVKDTNYRATSISNEEMNVFPYRNVAIVIGTYHSKGTYKGKAFDHRGRFTDTWIFQDGKWQCVASHTTLIGKG